MDPLITRLADVDPNSAKPGWVALLIVLGLAVATFLLWRNMGKQMKKIDFDENADSDEGRSRSSERTDKQPEENGSTG